MNPRTYTDAENVWTWRNKRSGLTSTGPLSLDWGVWPNAISDDYTPDETPAVDLLEAWTARLPDRSAEELFGQGAVGISWFISPELDSAPFELRRYGHGADVKDFLFHFTWPKGAQTGEQVNFLRLPVVDKLWRPGRGDRGGFLQEVTGWKPSALQPVMWPGPLMDAAGIGGPSWVPRVTDLRPRD